MSQAKTQMVNKSFGLNNNTDSNAINESTINGWSNDGLGQFGRSGGNNTSDNNSMNWTNPGQVNKLISNSSNSSSSDLWSNDINNHNNFSHNLEDFLKNDKNKVSSNSQNHTQFLKQQQNNQWADNKSFNHSNNNTNSSLNFNDNQQQQLPRANHNNQFLNSISNNGQSDLNGGPNNSSSTWNPFSSSSIIANSSNNNGQLQAQQLPNRPSSSASTASSTNTASDNNNTSNNHNNFNHSQQNNKTQWSNNHTNSQQNGWMDTNDISNSNEWQQQQQSNVNTNASSSTIHSSSNQHTTNLVRGGSASTTNNNNSSVSGSSSNPPPVAQPVPPPPSTSSSSSQAAAASSAKSWAKIVSQQSSPSTQPAPPTPTTNNTPTNNSAIPASQSQQQVNSSQSNQSPASNNNINSQQNSFGNNSFNIKGQSKPCELTQAEWNIKVNQQVPWEMANQNNNNSGANSLNSSTNQFNNSGNNNSNGMLQNQQTSNSACSSSASSSSSGTNGLIMQQNEAIMANLMHAKTGNFNPQQQNQVQQSGQKSQVDTGTDIWLSNKPKPNGPVSNWDSNNIQASNNSSNSQSSSSSPNTALQVQFNNNTQWSNNPTGGSGNNIRWNNNQENNNQWNQSGSQQNSGNGNNASWSGNNQAGNKQTQQTGSGTSSGSSTTSSSSQQPLGESTNQMNRWNQQQQQQGTPPPASTQVANPTGNTSNPNAMDLASQAAALKVNIEPQGWDDPDFKISKKSDDGTNIWGDPEHHRQVKVTKWMHVTRHMSSQQQQQQQQATNNKPNVDQENLMGGSIQPQQMSNSQSFNSGVGNNNGNASGGENQTSSSPTLGNAGGNSQWNQPGNNSNVNSSQQAKLLQQQISGSSWSNTPAAPLNLGGESLNNNESPIGSNVNEWTQDLVDTKSWSTFKDQAKTNFDPSVGIVDTSKWNGHGPQPGIATNNVNGFGQNQHQQQQDDMMKQQAMSRSSTNPLGGGLNSANMMNSVGRMPQQQTVQAQKNNMNLNLMQHQQPGNNMQSINSPQSLMGSVNANNNLNNMILNNANNNLNPSPQPQIQNQLIESFRLAVSSGIISADLLNTKLPQEVLTMLYQLFQTLSSYIASQNKINELNKRRANILPAQFKSESELLNLEAQTLKTNLVSLQTKINSAHQIIKQTNLNANNGNGNHKQSGSPSLVNTPPSNSVELAAAAAGVQLNDLPILKDHSNASSVAMNSQLNAQQQRSKLLQLLNDNDSLGKSNGMNNLSRQSSYQPGGASQANANKLQSQFSQPSPFSNMSNQWSNFDANSLMGMGNGPIVDDRITPFIPGQLWAGSQSSIEDDPNCTPGSVSKSLLSETIDPESILSGLQRGSHWSNFSDSLLNSNMGMIGNISQRNPMQRASGNSAVNNNVQNNWGGLGSQASMNSGSIGEQLWGVGSRSASRAGNPIAMPTANNGNGMNNNVSRNSVNNSGSSNNGFNSNNQMMNQQQQFFNNRNGVSNGNSNGNNNSNQWSNSQMSSNQNQSNNMNDLRQQQANSQQNNQFGNNSNVNSGNFILIRNVSAQVDQTTLRALCSQHASGQLTYYRYIPQMTCVIVRYNTKEEANNAQNKLNSVSLGNTQIFTQPLNENDLKFLFSM